MKIKNILYIVSLLLFSCKSESKKTIETITGKHQIIELIIGNEKKEINEIVYLKIEKDGLLFLENGSESKPFGDWRLDSTNKAVVFNIVDGNFNVRLNLTDDDSTFTLRGYTLGEQKVFYSFKFSKINNVINKNLITKTTEIHDVDSSLELVNVISYFKHNRKCDWNSINNFSFPVEWTSKTIEPSNENMAEKKFQLQGKFVPNINGKNYNREWTITLYGNSYNFFFIKLASYKGDEFNEQINIIEYLKEFYTVKLGYNKEYYILNSEKYGNGPITYKKNCDTNCSIELEF